MNAPPASAAWASSDDAVASVDSAGLVHANALGTATITASSGALRGSAAIAVSPPIPARLAVSPQSAVVDLGANQPFTVTGTVLSDGTLGPPPASVAWQSSDAAVASVDDGGVAWPVKLGSTTVTAKAGAVTGSGSLVVRQGSAPPQPASLVVSPATIALAPGGKQGFQVTGTRMTDGSVAAAPASAAWRSTDATVATVDASGVATAVAAGSARIEASAGGLTGAASVAVTPAAALVSVAVAPDPFTVVRGLGRRLRAVARFDDGTAQDVTALATWRTSDAGVAAVDGQGKVTGVAAGSASISAAFAAASGSASGSAAGTVLGQRVAFVTSEVGTGRLASWPSAAGKAGLAAADAVCSARAAAAGLAGRTFTAWLSDSFDDAYCRMAGLEGHAYDRCGQATTPAPSGGPWIRTDGAPFAASLSDLLAGKVLAPARYDETGQRAFTVYFTATGTDGARFAPYGTCADWTSDAPTAATAWPAVGVTDGGTMWWTRAGSDGCEWPTALLCLEVGAGAGPALPPYAAPGKRVFVTSVSGTGDLGSWPDAGGATGLAAADAICAARAAAARFGGVFRAWLSGGATSAASRVAGDGPWVRPDGVLVAASRLELLSGTLRTPIGVTELGAYVGYEGAFTASFADGSGAPADCAGWTSAAFASPGRIGTPAAANEEWTDLRNDSNCASDARLYCFEQ